MTLDEAALWSRSPDNPSISSRDEVFECVGGPYPGFRVLSYDCGGVSIVGHRGAYHRVPGSYLLEWRAA